MEIRNLISFVQVAEFNSFTKAAEFLGYSQSTISFQIKQLETELDCQLFERINHTITLTQKGKELLEYAHNINRLTDEFKQNFSDSKAPQGFIHIVTPDSLCETMLSENYLDFHRKYPGINLKFTTGDTSDMFKMLDRNEADMVLTLDSHVYQNDYVIAQEEPVGMHFVAGADSPFKNQKKLSVKDIAEEPFLLTEKGMGYRRVLDKALEKKSIQIVPALEVGRTDVIARLIEDGAGISYLPDFVTKEKVRNGSLIYLDVEDIENTIWKQLIYHKNICISNCMKIFIDYIKEKDFSQYITI